MVPQFHANVEIVLEPNLIDPAEARAVAAALQTQIVRDFSRIWPGTATVTVHEGTNLPGPDVWPIYVVSNLGADGYCGYHTTDLKQPSARVIGDANWSVSASHECLEMLVDPHGCALLSAPGLLDDGADDPSRTVQYLIEACDPVEGFSYPIQEGSSIRVADFCTPPYYLDHTARQGVPYSFRSNITAPRQIASKGYLTWFEADKRCRRMNRFYNDKLSVETVNGSPGTMTLREWSDRMVAQVHGTSQARTQMARGMLRSHKSQRSLPRRKEGTEK